MHEHPQLLHLDIAVIYGMKLQRHVYEFETSNVIWMTNPQEHDKEECWETATYTTGSQSLTEFVADTLVFIAFRGSFPFKWEP